MRYIWLAAKVLVFLLLLAFAVSNRHPVDFYFILGYAWNVPLIIILFLFFALGAALGLSACFMRLYRVRRELQALRRELRAVNEAPVRVHPNIEDTLA